MGEKQKTKLETQDPIIQRPINPAKTNNKKDNQYKKTEAQAKTQRPWGNWQRPKLSRTNDKRTNKDQMQMNTKTKDQARPRIKQDKHQ